MMVIRALQRVFRKPLYALLALAVSLAVFAFAVWLPNIPLIVEVMGHREISLSQKLDLPISLLGSIATNFTVLAASSIIAISVLFGVNLAMTAYFLKRRVDESEKGGIATGFLGVASGIIGIGCAGCGSVLLTSIFSLLGTSGILAFLPLAGQEFGILGVILLGASLYLAAKRIQDPAVCKLPSNQKMLWIS